MSNSFAALFGDDSDSDSEDGQPIKTAERRTASSVTAVRLSGDTTTTSTGRNVTSGKQKKKKHHVPPRWKVGSFWDMIGR